MLLREPFLHELDPRHCFSERVCARTLDEGADSVFQMVLSVTCSVGLDVGLGEVLNDLTGIRSMISP